MVPSFSTSPFCLDKLQIGDQSSRRSVETPHEAVPTSENPVGFLCP